MRAINGVEVVSLLCLTQILTSAIRLRGRYLRCFELVVDLVY